MAFRLIYAGWSAAALASSLPVAAAETPVSSALATIFAETCLGGQPSFQGTRWAAVAAGWTPQPVRVVSAATGARVDAAAAPIFLKKDGFILTLIEDERGGDDHLCGVSTSTDDPLTTAALVHALSQAASLGDPVILDDEKGERALWRLGGAMRVEASVRRKGSLRNANLVSGPTARMIALRD